MVRQMHVDKECAVKSPINQEKKNLFRKAKFNRFLHTGQAINLLRASTDLFIHSQAENENWPNTLCCLWQKKERRPSQDGLLPYYIPPLALLCLLHHTHFGRTPHGQLGVSSLQNTE